MSEFKPPVCPSCGASLTRVYETIYEDYVFNPENGGYELDEDKPFGNASSMTCPNCGHDLLPLFPEGLCNYKAENLPS